MAAGGPAGKIPGMVVTATPQNTPPMTSLVVPTARLAAALRRHEARQQLRGGAQVWQARDVLGLGAWVTRQSLPARSDGRLPAFALLNQEQAQALWMAVMAADGADGAEADTPLELRPAQAEALARHMAEAEETTFGFGLAAIWQAPLPLTLEQTLARRWQRAFRARCEALGVGTRTMLLEACAARGIGLAAAGSASRGFDTSGPVLRGLLPPPEPTIALARVPQHHHFLSTEDECDAALAWAEAARAAGGDGGVAIVCVDMKSVDLLLARATRWRIARGEPAGSPAALNAPLARTAPSPLVAHALLAWQAQQQLAPADAITLLTSPYLDGWRSEFGARARLAARIQTERASPLRLAHLLELAEAADCPGFVRLLQNLQPLAGQARRRRPMSQWAQFLTQWLSAWGWPGGEGLSAQEHAALEAWRRALDTIAALDLVLPPQTQAEAGTRIRQIMRGIGAAEAMAPDAIDLLSVEEAAVLRPARVWVLGLHDAAWPAVPASNPLLPPAMLRRAGVPGSDAAADARQAQRLLEQVVGVAQEAVLSVAQHDGDTPRRPSGAIAWPAGVIAEAPSLFAAWRDDDASRLVEDLPPEPPVPLPPAQPAHGGTGILAAQAACAFRAFAQYRLLADTVDDAEPGVDARTRGEIVHAAMALLWQGLGTQAAARALDPAARDEAIAAAIEGALDAALATRPGLHGRARGLEARRVHKLMRQALAQDLLREPFAVVATEEARELTLGALRVGLRIDRVDRLDDGAELILDYKTGEVRAKDWLLPRPLAPQLLAYALAREDAGEGVELAGIGYAQLKPAKCRLVTLNRKPDEPDPRGLWRAELTALAEDYVSGYANLDPKEGAKTCQRCDFQVLCRVHEQPPLAGDDEVGDES